MADITEQDIERVARAVFAASSGASYPFDHSPSQDVYRIHARAALEAAAELGWARKPTRSEVHEALRSFDWQRPYPTVLSIGDALVEAGFAVEDPAPEWEPTEAAVKEALDVFSDKRNGSIEALLKLIRAKPHLIGLGEGE